ncbi:MAG: NADPH-dependent FMN reductase [Candidatus Paceibacterota bacterium]
MKKIIFLLGTAREGRKSEGVFNFVLDIVKQRSDIEPQLVDIRDYPQQATEGLSTSLTEKWRQMIKEAHGLVIVSPEYNHGYPGELKMFLDNAYAEYEGKPVAICGVSNGPVGGARMVEQLKLVLSAFQMMIINAGVYFANVNDIFDTSGTMQNREYWEKRVNGMLDELIKYA